MDNIILIGMPGSGKSTLGVLLAKRLGWDFLDTDLLIQHREGRRLQDILDRDGFEILRDREADALATVSGTRQVISTGGSAVYRERGMARLKSIGTIVHLDASIATIRTRVRNWDSRGIAAPPGTTLEQLHAERSALYRRWADLTLPVDSGTQESLADELATRLGF